MQFFDALTELDYHAQCDSWDGQMPSLTSYPSVREDSTRPAQRAVHPSGNRNNGGSSGSLKILSRSSWGEASWEDDDEEVQESKTSRAGSLAWRQQRQSSTAESRATGAAGMPEAGATTGRKWRAVSSAPCVFAALGWCCKPALRVLGRRSVDKASYQ